MRNGHGLRGLVRAYSCQEYEHLRHENLVGVAVFDSHSNSASMTAVTSASSLATISVSSTSSFAAISTVEGDGLALANASSFAAVPVISPPTFTSISVSS